MSLSIIRRVETQPGKKSQIRVIKKIKPAVEKTEVLKDDEKIEVLEDGSIKTTKGGNTYISRCENGWWWDTLDQCD